MATATAQSLIQAAMEELGVYAPGETMSDADSSRSLWELNKLLDEWASQNLFVYQLTTMTASLTNGKSSYTVGTVGSPDISAIRPPRIQMGPGAATVTVTGVTTNVNVVSQIEWSAIEGNSAVTQSGTPDTLWYDPQYPLGVINVAPKPNASATLSFFATLILQQFATLSTSANLSLGVQTALQDNLAVALQSYFKDSQINPAVPPRAMEGKDFLRYQSMTSRAMLKRRMFSTGRAPAPPSGGE